MKHKKKIAYIETPKCANNSIQAALARVGDKIGFEASHPSHQRRYAPMLSREQERELPTVGDRLEAWKDINRRVDDGAFCVMPFTKFPFHRTSVYDPDSDSWNQCLHEYWRQSVDDDWAPLERTLSKFDTDEFYTWTVVRNPWDRVASAYFHCKKVRPHLAEISFVKFVKNATDPHGFSAAVCSHEPHEFITKSYLGQNMGPMEIRCLSKVSELTFMVNEDGDTVKFNSFLELFPSNRWMHDCNRTILVHTQRWEDSHIFKGYKFYLMSSDRVGAGAWIPSTAYPEKTSLDRVVRFENLQNGFDQVMADLDLPTVKLPHKNRGQHSGNLQKYRELYTPETIELVRDHYRYEIETFGYEFGK